MSKKTEEGFELIDDDYPFESPNGGTLTSDALNLTMVMHHVSTAIDVTEQKMTPLIETGAVIFEKLTELTSVMYVQSCRLANVMALDAINYFEDKE